MKHIAILSLFTLSASAAVPLRWTVETSRAVPAQFEAYQGETLALEAALKSYGKPLEAPSNYSLYWQTNGMGNAYWSTNVSNVSNVSNPSNLLRATWTPSMETGAKVYNCFIGQPGTVYHAAFQLRLRPSPGALPNELPLPQKVIDFAKVTVLNPPWSGGGGSGVDTNAVRDIAREEIAPATNVIEAQLAALQDGKRGLIDEDAYIDQLGLWVAGEGAPSDFTQPQPTIPEEDTRPLHLQWDALDAPWMADLTSEDDETALFVNAFDSSQSFTATRTKSTAPDPAHKLAKRAANPVTGAIAKFDADKNLIAATPSSHNVEGDFRAPTDNECHADSPLLDWVRNSIPEGFVSRSDQPVWNYSEFVWELTLISDPSVPRLFYLRNVQEDVVGTYEFTWEGGETPVSFTATRSRAATSGESFTTQSFVTNAAQSAAAAAVSTNNPAFVSAVRNTPAPEPRQGEDPPWGTWGTVGAAIAGLVSGLAWLKNKIGVIFDNEGEIQDDFATDLLGKQVAISAMHYDRYSVQTTGDDAWKLHDRSVNSFTMTDDETVTFPDPVDGKCRDLLLLVTHTDGELTLPTGNTYYGDAPTMDAGETYLLALTEIAANTWYMRTIKMEVPA